MDHSNYTTLVIQAQQLEQSFIAEREELHEQVKDKQLKIQELNVKIARLHVLIHGIANDNR